MTTYLLILAAFFGINFSLHKTRRAIILSTLFDAAVLAVCAGLIELVSRIMEGHP
jgi:hypothetical protein